MATITNDLSHTASLTNETGSPSTFGQHTMAELAAYTLAQLAAYTFNSQFIVFSNEASHTASLGNEASH